MKIRGVAERGYPLRYPENTISSFQAAIDLNFTHTKLEVHLTKDGVPVVMQDPTINRMTSGKGEIKDFTYAELSNYIINHDEKIPTLEEVLRITKGKIKAGIEIVQTGFYHGLEEKVSGIIQMLDAEKDVFLLSRNHYALARLRILSQEMELGLITDEPNHFDIHLMKELNVTYYAFPFDFETIQQLELTELEKCGIQTIASNVNTINKMKFMQQYPSILVSTTELEKYIAICSPHTITDWQKVGL